MLQQHLQPLDRELIEGEVARLYEQYAAALLRFGWCQCGSQETAQEGLQETFLRFFVERTYGREILNPKAWLYEVLRNYIRDRMSAPSVRREVAAEHMERVPDRAYDPEVMVERDQMARQIAASLSERELECLRLRTEGMSYEEIGETMQIRSGTVGATLARVYNKIRKRDETDGGEASMLAAAVFFLAGRGESCIPG
jgi:RNA polymerase sigma-70 factor (ECF subfamily)